MTNNDILEALYNHPHNGEDNVFIAAFVSSDRTYPIFVWLVTETTDGTYQAHCTAPKWGYESPDKLQFIWYSDEQLLRDTSERLYTVAQINSYRWRPANQSLRMPDDIAQRFRLQPLRVFVAHINQDSETPLYGTIVALDERHARLQFATQSPEESLDWLYEIPLDRPLIEYMTP